MIPIVAYSFGRTFLLHQVGSLFVAHKVHPWWTHTWRGVSANSKHQQHVKYDRCDQTNRRQDANPLPIGKRSGRGPFVHQHGKQQRTKQGRNRNDYRYRVDLVEIKALVGHVGLEEGIDASQTCNQIKAWGLTNILWFIFAIETFNCAATHLHKIEIEHILARYSACSRIVVCCPPSSGASAGPASNSASAAESPSAMLVLRFPVRLAPKSVSNGWKDAKVEI